MKLKLDAVYEPLDVEVGDEVVRLSIDLSDETRLERAQACLAASQRLAAVAKLAEDAEARHDAEASRRLQRDYAKDLRAVAALMVGEEGTEAVLDALKGGRHVPDAACNSQMAKLVGAISEVVAARNATAEGGPSEDAGAQA